MISDRNITGLRNDRRILKGANMSELFTANNVEEACAFLRKGCIACAGGTNLFVDRHHGKYADRDIVSLHRLTELRSIAETEDAWQIGSLVTFCRLEDYFLQPAKTMTQDSGACGTAGEEKSYAVGSEKPESVQASAAAAGRAEGVEASAAAQKSFDGKSSDSAKTGLFGEGQGCAEMIGTAASLVGGPQIRNRGTIGGNILSASPAADLVPVLMALDAEAFFQGTEGNRSLPIRELMLGPGKTAVFPDEILLSIRVPKKRGRSLFRKVGRRNALAISVINAAVYLETESGMFTSAAIALGSAAPTAVRAVHAEKVLAGRTVPTDEAAWQELQNRIREALQHDISPIDDIRASASYRRKVAGNMVCDMIRALA